MMRKMGVVAVTAGLSRTGLIWGSRSMKKEEVKDERRGPEDAR